ncbi:hypothetical protein [Paracoccus aminophilus]|uniref:hypothetical protein n=1 Tax=Paracoccus aminophilus TaxID=34003 RepID=UPI0011DD0562|nr:hypothetical protein [Paracoccus aminophilus]
MLALDEGEFSGETLALSQGLSFSEMLSFFRKGHPPAEISKRGTGRKDRVMLILRKSRPVMRVSSAFADWL